MEQHPLNQSSSCRAWVDTKKWLLNSFIAWIIVAAVSGMITAIVIPTINTIIFRAIYGFIGAVIALILIICITYIVHLAITPYRQRNEVRKSLLEKQKPVPISNKDALIRAIITLTQSAMELVIEQELLEKPKLQTLGLGIIPKINESKFEQTVGNYKQAMHQYAAEGLIAGESLHETLISLNYFINMQVDFRLITPKPLGIDGKPVLLDSLHFINQLSKIRDYTIRKINETTQPISQKEGSQN